IYSYDRPETIYDDRFVVVHLTEPSTPDETDATGDTNGNGVVDLYCDNYYGSLWNSDCVVAIDSDDDPRNGGIIDFMAYSNRDGSANSTMSSYMSAARDHGQWYIIGELAGQESAVDIGTKGLSSYMGISRVIGSDTNALEDFVVTRYQTPGKENVISVSAGFRKLFKVDKKTVSIVPGSRRPGSGTVPLFLYEHCNIKFRIFSVTGMLVHESPLYRSLPPGDFSLQWNSAAFSSVINRGVPTGLYIGKIEATGTSERISETESVYIVVVKK
ncbi:MAG: hypothetical protein GY754_35410, partial [bacterium]|nr:hypothetical protein [bacterium]